ncbi:CHASE sensor domain-containing protein [Pseudodesulfovibrio sp.]|uniref:sensor histidine kinase n=1 Tax=Pseudodesulfovibrio sp. TaxID=2035812 RepID=UPI00260DF74D|nr:CHASE sensor domain-containing protein [Pseudodesulfovibrio sp.]MDD3311605.1 CHASE sensor domain-containing protein [Pseudodesulfovibrio sp.]
MSDRAITPLGRKIMAAILGSTLIALALAFLLHLGPTVYAFRQEVAARVSAQAELMAASLAAPVDFDDAQAATENLATLSLVGNVRGAAVYPDEGPPLAVYAQAPERLASDRAVCRFGLSSLRVACPIPAQRPGAVLVMEVTLEDQWNLLRDAFLIGLAILPLILVFSYRLAGRFRHKLGDPLGALTAAVRDISRNKDFTRRVDYRSDDEIGLLVAEFNAMLDHIEDRDARLNQHREQLERTVDERTAQLREKQRELLRNNRLLKAEIRKRVRAEMIREEVERINRHDLKSGLSLVIGYPELLLNGGGLNPEQEQYVKRIRSAGYRMLDMIRNQLDIFKMEKGFYALKKADVDLVELLCDLEEEFLPQLRTSGVTLEMLLDNREVEGREEFIVQGERQLLRALLRNLILNAIEASNPGQHVTVILDGSGPKRVTVANPTPVPEEVRPRFFAKYVTHGKENGTGLGTYFAALIARTHGADIAMHTSQADGTAVNVVFR